MQDAALRRHNNIVPAFALASTDRRASNTGRPLAERGENTLPFFPPGRKSLQNLCTQGRDLPWLAGRAPNTISRYGHGSSP